MGRSRKQAQIGQVLNLERFSKSRRIDNSYRKTVPRNPTLSANFFAGQWNQLVAREATSPSVQRLWPRDGLSDSVLAVLARRIERARLDERSPARSTVAVVIEGLDGAGKSTLARALYKRLRERRLAATLRHHETHYLPDAYRRIRTTRDPHARFFLQMASASLLAIDLTTRLSGRVCVCDRYFSSAVAYYESITGLEVPRTLWSVLPPPSISVLLDCPSGVRYERLSSRKPRVSSRKLETTGPLGDRILGRMVQHADWVTLRSDSLSLAACVAVLEEMIREEARTESI